MSGWLYAHVFILLSVVIVTLPIEIRRKTGIAPHTPQTVRITPRFNTLSGQGDDINTAGWWGEGSADDRTGAIHFWPPYNHPALALCRLLQLAPRASTPHSPSTSRHPPPKPTTHYMATASHHPHKCMSTIGLSRKGGQEPGSNYRGPRRSPAPLVLKQIPLDSEKMGLKGAWFGSNCWLSLLRLQIAIEQCS